MDTKIKRLCDQVRETAYAIHEYHGTGHLEKVYENALTHRLRKLGLKVEQQHPLKVRDEDGTLINFGSYPFQIKKFVMDKVKPIPNISKAISILLTFAPFALFRG